MTKIRISATVDEKIWFKIRDALKNNPSYKNKSQLIQKAVEHLLEVKADG